MVKYALKRLFFIFPTLLGILVLNFLLVQALPGGPVEQMIAKIQGDGNFQDRLSGETSTGTDMDFQDFYQSAATSKYAGAQGIDPEFIAELEKQFGFDKPPFDRFLLMIKNYLSFNLGKSYFRDQDVISLFVSKLPVSLSLGLWSTLLIYLISIPLGIAKAVHDGTRFDVATSVAIIIGYALPGFLFGLLLLIVFAGGSFFDWFPLRGIVSDGWSEMAWYKKITDYIWHMTLPLITMVIGGFASLTLLTKNSFLEEINKQYVLTAKAKGLSSHRILYGHIFRNAMLIVVVGIPTALLHILFTSALLTEVIFSLDGLGYLGFEAALNRDYPIMFGLLYIFSLTSLIMNIIGDLAYSWVDPRIDFEKRENS